MSLNNSDTRFHINWDNCNYLRKCKIYQIVMYVSFEIITYSTDIEKMYILFNYISRNSLKLHYALRFIDVSINCLI